MGSFLVLIQNERLAIVTLEPSSANPQVLFKVSTAGKRALSFRVNQHLLRKHKTAGRSNKQSKGSLKNELPTQIEQRNETEGG